MISGVQSTKTNMENLEIDRKLSIKAELVIKLVERGEHLQSASQRQLSIEYLICLIDRHFPSKVEDQRNGKPHQQDCLVVAKQ